MTSMPKIKNPTEAMGNNEYMAMVLLVDDQAIIGEATNELEHARLVGEVEMRGGFVKD